MFVFYNLDCCREKIKDEFKDDLTAICEFTDEAQSNDMRICPRNIYQDEKAERICVRPCRKRYATCFKKYFKEEQK